MAYTAVALSGRERAATVAATAVRGGAGGAAATIEVTSLGILT